MKYTVNSKSLIVVAIILVLADMAFLAFHPAYRVYKQNEKTLRERLEKWENGFKKEYIESINNVAVSLTNKPSSRLPPSVQKDVQTPISKPLDLELDGYMYFEASGYCGFSIHGRLIFRVGDSFLGRRVVSADRFGAVLSDGGIIRPSLSSIQRKHEEAIKHDNTNGG